jgi:chorismate synthase
MSSSFGARVRFTGFGQSHAPAIGCVLEGLPAGFRIDWDAVQAVLDRRAPGRSALATARREADVPRVLSGLNARGETCGAPLCVLIENTDARSGDYDALARVPRPGHADYPAWVKTGGHRDARGGGEYSGRLTAPLCVAGAVCAQWLGTHGIRIAGRIAEIAGIEDAPLDTLFAEDVSIGTDFPVVDNAQGARMRAAIEAARTEGDSVGGVVEAWALGVPPGLGAPPFDGLENRIAQALFAIPAVKGVEFGAGFAAARMRGSLHNDPYTVEAGVVRTRANRHGGILGGLSTGMPIVVRAAFKPTPSIALPQASVDLETLAPAALEVRGRHDPCVVPRAAPCAEAALALALADFVTL